MSSLTGEPGHTTSTERTRAVIDAWDLQRIAELGWPGTEVAHVAGWSVRAGRGFTRRANSALPLGPSTANLDERLAAVRAWYGERDLPTLLQVPEPAGADLASELSARGWARGTAVSVQTASAETILSRCSPPADLPAPITTTVPDERWLALYHYRGGDLPPKALEVLTAGERPLFHTTASVVRRSPRAGSASPRSRSRTRIGGGVSRLTFCVKRSALAYAKVPAGHTSRSRTATPPGWPCMTGRASPPTTPTRTGSVSGGGLWPASCRLSRAWPISPHHRA